MKKQWVKFMCSSFLNGQNIGLYKQGNAYFFQVDDQNSCTFKKSDISFVTESSADEWYSRIHGSGLGKLANALELLEGDQAN